MNIHIQLPVTVETCWFRGAALLCVWLCGVMDLIYHKPTQPSSLPPSFLSFFELSTPSLGAVLWLAEGAGLRAGISWCIFCLLEWAVLALFFSLTEWRTGGGGGGGRGGRREERECVQVRRGEWVTGKRREEGNSWEKTGNMHLTESVLENGKRGNEISCFHVVHFLVSSSFLFLLFFKFNLSFLCIHVIWFAFFLCCPFFSVFQLSPYTQSSSFSFIAPAAPITCRGCERAVAFIHYFALCAFVF